MGRKEHNVSVTGEPTGQSDEEISAGISGAVLQRNPLTPEFYELIFEADPEALNDDYYVTSRDFVQLHSKIKKDLIRGVSWWLLANCLFIAGMVILYPK